MEDLLAPSISLGKAMMPPCLHFLGGNKKIRMTQNTQTFTELVSFIRNAFNTADGFIPLHEPRFVGNEKKYLLAAIDSTFVSSVGKFVDQFEEKIKEYTGAGFAVATVNGTAALHIALELVGVSRGDLVITQPLTFVATCNAISYTGASPVFVDIDVDTLGLSYEKLLGFLEKEVTIGEDRKAYHKATRKKISACVPMHTFGHPAEIDKIVELCEKYQIPVVEDSAESLGSFYKGKHTGSYGTCGVFSFNGNKTITAGGGGVVITNSEELAAKCKHLTTQAKEPHRWEFKHDEVGYNYRLPNINAALACAQLEKLEEFIVKKRNLAAEYESYLKDTGFEFIKEPPHARSNYWLNSILLKNKRDRDEFLKFTNENGVMTRPCWILMNKLAPYATALCGDLSNAEDLENRLVSLPSSVILDAQL